MKQNKEQQKLSAEIMRHRDLYYNDAAEISDADFDFLVKQLSKIDPDDPAITMVGAPLKHSEWKKVKHEIDMGSLDKRNTPDEMRDWIEKNLEQSSALFWTEKLDGFSIECIYKKGILVHALTRGQGKGDGEDILSNVVRMGGVKTKLPFSGSLRGEIMLLRSKFEEHFPETKNPRNTAAGVARRYDGEGSEYLDAYFYQAIADDDYGEVALQAENWTTDYEQLDFIKWLGLNTPKYGLIKGSNKQKFTALEAVWREYQEKIRDNLNYEIDGLVSGIDNLNDQAALGEHNLRPKGKVAWKFENQEVETTITGIEWTTKKAGRISPTVLVNPVSVLGSIVSRASLYNYDYIENLGLGEGAVVRLVKANEIIPRIQSVVKPPKKVFPIPTKCPECNGDVRKENVYLICASDGCIGKKTGIINSWIKNIGVMEWGKALIDKLVEANLVNDISDLYTLTEEDLLSLERMGEISAEKDIKELWKVKEIPLHIFVGSLGILNVGRTTIELAIDNGKDTLTKLFQTTEGEFSHMKGIGPVKAKALHDGLRENSDLINQIIENGIKIAKVSKKTEIVGGKLIGMKICITGKTDIKRDVWKERIEAAGGIFEKAVKIDTNYLVIVDPDSTTVKANSARANGTKLINESQLESMIQ